MSAKMISDRFKSAEYARQVHRARPEVGTQLADVLDPGYWAHVAGKMTVGDKIEVMPEDGGFYAELLVVSCSKLHAKVVVLMDKQLNAAPKPATGKKEPFELAFKGPQRKWSVIRNSDKANVKEGFESKDEAAAWLKENEADLMG